jgi:hypothetical protein
LGYVILSSTQVVEMGKAATTGHSMAAGDVIFGGDVEVDGKIWADNNINIASNMQLAFGAPSAGLDWSTNQATSNTLVFGIGSTPKSLIFTDFANRNKDHDHAAQANPTIFMHSATDPDTANTQWLSIGHDQANGFITTGLGHLALGTDAATGHSLAAGDVLIGAKLEVDGAIWADGGINVVGGIEAPLGSEYATGSAATSTAANTNNATFTTGDASNAGDYVSGFISIDTGTTTTLGNSGSVTVRSGNAADTSGNVQMRSGTSANSGEASGTVILRTGNQTHATGGSSGSWTGYTGTAAGQAATGAMNLYTGTQTNTGNYASGAITIYSGGTATDGDSGDVTIRTGAAGAGSGDAGDVVFQTHGANTRLTILGVGPVQNAVHTETIADDAGGTHASATITPTSNFILCDCDDAHGCTITMGESGMVSGITVTIVGETATHCDFSDTDGVSNLTAAMQMDDDDSLTLVYSVDEWVEVSRADN